MLDDLPAPPIRGRHLRYLLVLILDRVRRPMGLAELDRAVAAAGFSVVGPPGKAARTGRIAQRCDRPSLAAPARRAPAAAVTPNGRLQPPAER